jgi:hypothetical protein
MVGGDSSSPTGCPTPRLNFGASMEFRHVLETVRLIAVPAAGLMESGYLVTSLAGDPVAAGQPAQVAALRYTNHRPTATAAEIVPLHIKGSFAPGDRAKILRAVNEWNGTWP